MDQSSDQASSQLIDHVDDPVDDERADERTDQTLREPPATGDDHVDEAVHALAQAMREPLEMQVQAFERAHRGLQDRLADVES